MPSVAHCDYKPVDSESAQNEQVESSPLCGTLKRIGILFAAIFIGSILGGSISYGISQFLSVSFLGQVLAAAIGGSAGSAILFGLTFPLLGKIDKPDAKKADSTNEELRGRCEQLNKENEELREGFEQLNKNFAALQMEFQQLRQNLASRNVEVLNAE